MTDEAKDEADDRTRSERRRDLGRKRNPARGARAA